MTPTLEREYRHLIRWYPQSWRAAWADDMLGTFLDVAKSENRTNPRTGERISIAIHGLAAHLEICVPGHIRNLSSTVALSSGIGAAIVTFVFSSWAPWVSVPGIFAAGFVSKFGPFFDTGPILAVLWVIAFASALIGMWKVGRVVLGLSIIAALTMPHGVMLVNPHWVSIDSPSLTFSVVAAVLAIFGTPLRGRALHATAGGWALICMIGYASHRGFSPNWQPAIAVWNQPGTAWMICLFIFLFATACMIARKWHIAAFGLLASLPSVAALCRGGTSGFWLGLDPGATILAALVVLGLLITSTQSAISARVMVANPTAPKAAS